MLKRLETDLHVGVSRDPMPTVEVDIDSIPAEHDGYASRENLGIRNLVWVSGFMAVVALISKDGF